MLYLFSGDDSKNKILNYEKFIKSLTAQIGMPASEIFLINRNSFDQIQIESFYSGSGLFSALSAVVFQNIFEYEETRDFVLDKLKRMGESDNFFIFLEGKLSKPIFDAFKKVEPKRLQMNIFELPKVKKEKYDNFLVANAFANKDKLNMWICFRQAMDLGVGMEEIIGVLFWKIKDMILKNPPERLGSSGRAGNFNKFSKSELQNLAAKLSYLLPEARKEGRDAEAAFEQFLLEAF